MAPPAQGRRRALYDEYLNVPEHLRAVIIRGTLYVTPRPAPRHTNATSVMGAELNGPFQLGRSGPGGWWILFEPELHLIDLEPMVPNLAGWRVERMPELPDTAYFTIVPDWICEVDLDLGGCLRSSLKTTRVADPLQPSWRGTAPTTRQRARPGSQDPFQHPHPVSSSTRPPLVQRRRTNPKFQLAEQCGHQAQPSRRVQLAPPGRAKAGPPGIHRRRTQLRFEGA